MTESDIKVYWYYFRSLATQLKQTEQYEAFFPIQDLTMKSILL